MLDKIIIGMMKGCDITFRKVNEILDPFGIAIPGIPTSVRSASVVATKWNQNFWTQVRTTNIDCRKEESDTASRTAARTSV